jgi:hypothetical protein
MAYKRNDIQRWIELSFINDCKILQEAKSLDEYYDKANTGLYEFLNPDLAYNYEEHDASEGQKMWKIEKQGDDPIMVVTLKKQGLGNKYWVLDFYFPETEKGYSKNQGLKGKHYLDTVSKIVKDEIIPYFEQSELNDLFFKSYTNDGAGQMRKSFFQRAIDKFISKDKFNIKIDNSIFIITKKTEQKR